MIKSKGLAIFSPQPLAALPHEAVEELARHKGEPPWLRQHRLEAWQTFDALPMPSPQDEDWRRTDIGPLPTETFSFYDDPNQQAEGPQQLARALRLSLPQDGAGLLVQHNSRVVYQTLADDLAQRGVVFTSLEEAVHRHGQLLQEYLTTPAVPASHGKFAALNAALWSGGVCLYVPPGVAVRLPLHSHLWASRSRLAVVPRTLVVLAQGSSLTYVDEYASAPAARGILHSGVVELFVGDGAHLRYITLQRWGTGVRNFMTQRMVLGRDAQLETMLIGLGGGLTKAYVETVLAATGSQARLYGLLLGDGRQHFDHQTLQDHQGPNTSSDLLFKVALKDSARSVFTGLVVVRPEARRTNSYLANRNLLLSDKAKADAIPKLEISTSDVIRCGHGSSVGQVDEAQLFYLMSRGLPRPEAERAIVSGFFESLLVKIPSARLRQRVHRYLKRKLNRGG